MLKKTLIALFAAPFLVIILGVTAMLVVLNWPTIVINPTTLGIAARHLAPIGIDVHWRKACTSSLSHGAFDETFTIAFEELCLSMGPELESACLDKLEASVRYRFRAIMPDIVELGPVALDGARIVIAESEDDEKKHKRPEGKIPIPDISIPGWLAKARIRPVDIDVRSIEVGSSMSGEAGLHVKPDEDGKVDRIAADASIRLAGGKSLAAKLTATSGSNFLKGDWKLDIESHAGLGGGSTANVRGDVRTAGSEQIESDLKISFAQNELRATADVEALAREDFLGLTLRAEALGIAEMIPRVGLRECSITLERTSELRNRGELELSCPVDIKLKKYEMPDGVEPIYRQPEDIFVDMAASAKTFFFPDMDEQTKAKLRVKLAPSKNRLVRMGGNLELEYSGRFSDPPKSWKVKSNADIDFTVDRFGQLVLALQNTPWPMPAPLNVLDGSLEFSIEGSVSSETGQAVFPAKLSADLESTKQRIKMDSDGKLTVHIHGASVGNLSLDLDVSFEDVQLQLPDVSMAAIPRFTPDGRIRLEPAKDEEKKEEGFPVDYDLKLSTPEGRPIRILSNVTPEYIPISVDVQLTQDDMSGEVKVDEFPIKLFSRKATLDGLELALREPVAKSEVQGSLSVPFPDLTVSVVVAGPVEEPSISLESKPPMSQGDIVSMLLYGEPMDALDDDQASSVSSTNAAMADRAMALTSFFLLGSTPIQSVSYNPETKKFTARIRLGKKTSLTVGGGDSQQEVGIKQRLGKGWSIKTGWEKTDESSSGAASAYIEWSKRY